VILIITRVDSASIFKKSGYGSFSVITSVISLLTLASTLTHNDASVNSKFNVVFGLFDGENWGYIGSSRAAFEMKNGLLQSSVPNYHIENFSLSKIKIIIELSQLAPKADPKDNNLYFRIDPISYNKISNDNNTNLVNQLLKVEEFAKLNGLKLHIEKEYPLPPSSIHSFLRENVSIPAFVASLYDKKYDNKYYNSFLDNYRLTENAISDFEYVRKTMIVIAKLVQILIGNDQKLEPEKAFNTDLVSLSL